jgi:hypothetical protein
MITVYRGAQAPEAIAVTITRGRTDLDLSTVNSVTFVVRDSSGTERTWNATINDGHSDSQLTASYQFASSGLDVSAVGQLRVMPHLNLIGGGVRRCVPFTLQVVE